MNLDKTTRVVDGVETELLEGGSGAPLLYLHAGDGLEAAEPLVERLAANFRVYAPSHPGFGGSALPTRISSVDDLAYFYLDLMDDLDFDCGVVVGVSFGGWIAAEIAVRNISRLSHLVLGAPVGAKFGDRESRGIADLFVMTDKELGERLYASPKPPPDYPSMSENAVERAVRNRESFTFFSWSPTLYNPKLRQRLHRIEVPTLLLWGAEDRVLAFGYDRDFENEIAAARSQVIAGAGHYLHCDRPAELAAAVANFVAPQPAPSDAPRRRRATALGG